MNYRNDGLQDIFALLRYPEMSYKEVQDWSGSVQSRQILHG